jgi:hypothetical protein
MTREVTLDKRAAIQYQFQRTHGAQEARQGLLQFDQSTHNSEQAVQVIQPVVRGTDPNQFRAWPLRGSCPAGWYDIRVSPHRLPG